MPFLYSKHVSEFPPHCGSKTKSWPRRDLPSILPSPVSSSAFSSHTPIAPASLMILRTPVPKELIVCPYFSWGCPDSHMALSSCSRLGLAITYSVRPAPLLCVTLQRDSPQALKTPISAPFFITPHTIYELCSFPIVCLPPWESWLLLLALQYNIIIL